MEASEPGFVSGAAHVTPKESTHERAGGTIALKNTKPPPCGDYAAPARSIVKRDLFTGSGSKDNEG